MPPFLWLHNSCKKSASFLELSGDSVRWNTSAFQAMPDTEGCCVSAVYFVVVLILHCELRKYRHTGDIHDHPLMTAGFFKIIYLAALGFSCCVWDLVP